MELEKIILSEITQTQRDKLGVLALIGLSELQIFRRQSTASSHCRTGKLERGREAREQQRGE